MQKEQPFPLPQGTITTFFSTILQDFVLKYILNCGLMGKK